MDLAWCDPAENLRRMEQSISSRLKASARIPADSRIFVFPETTLTGFVTEGCAEASLLRDGPEVQAVRDLAKKYSIAIIFGFPEKVETEKVQEDSKPFNTLLFTAPNGDDVGDFHKIHLYTAGASPESSSYRAGDSGTLLSYRGWKIGLATCFDLRFARLFHCYSREGADLVILPACWIGGPGKSYQLATLSAARAIEGQYFFAALNRSGKDPFASYEGEALCFGPKGQALVDQGGFELDSALLDEARKLQVRPSDLEEYPIVMN
jgi:predicted amidohydrolase